MSLMAVFNCSFLITLILFLLIIGLIWIHFNQKINDQNIKMNQMVHLLTTMTQEVSLLRTKVGLSFNEEIIDISENINEDKIDVSDNEYEDSDSEDSNSEDSESEETDSDIDSDDSDAEVSVVNPKSLIELIEVKTENIKSKELNKLEEQLKDSEEQLNKLEEQLDKLEDLPQEELIQNQSIDQSLEELTDQFEDIIEEQVEEQVDKEEYKKMSLNKLKSLVLEKKLTSDVSKLKKNDLLTILGIEG